MTASKQNRIRRSTQRLLQVALVLLLLAGLLSLSACSAVGRLHNDFAGLKEPVGELLDNSSKALESAINPEETSGSNLPESQASVETPLETSRETPTSSQKTEAGADFNELVTALIRDALDNYRNKAVLDAAMVRYRFTEAQSDELIARIYDLYEQVFRQNPQYYWLDGSARITYSILQTDDPTFSALTLEMGFTPGFAEATPQTLKTRQEQLLQVARDIAGQAADAGEPWQQLLAVHDILVRSIVYDSTLNQETNNAASALLDRITLCQGYAQSFQLIAQALGFEVSLITGSSENVDHAWNLVWLDGQPYHVDVTHDDPVPDGGPEDLVSHVHFLRSDAQMQQTHIWVKENYPEAELDGAHYYRRQGLEVATQDELDARIGAFVAEADLQDDQPNRLELLYIGADLPSKETIEDLMISYLRQRSGVRSIVYRTSVDKSVVTLELLPA